MDTARNHYQVRYPCGGVVSEHMSMLQGNKFVVFSMHNEEISSSELGYPTLGLDFLERIEPLVCIFGKERVPDDAPVLEISDDFGNLFLEKAKVGGCAHDGKAIDR